MSLLQKMTTLLTAFKSWQRITMALLWWIIMTILFCLPGSDLPSAHWLDEIYFDKWVHIGLFLVLAVLWCWGLWLHRSKHYWMLLASAALYGYAIEIIQLKFIPNRSYDLSDLMADVAGSFIGVGLWVIWYKKSKPL